MQTQSIAFDDKTGTPDRLALWGDFVRRHIGWLEADTIGDRQFDGCLELGEHRTFKVCGIAASRHRVVRTPRLIRRDDRGYVKIVAQLSGVARFEQAGRSVVIAPGDWSIYDTTQSYVVSNPDRIQQAAVLMPRDQLTRLGLDLDKIVVRRFNRSGFASRQAFDLLAGALAGLRSHSHPDDDFGELLADLVRRTALEQDGVFTEAALQSRLKDRIMAYVAANLPEPSLSIDAIAAAFGCSKRYLHKIFAGEPDTLNGFIWQSRLERVRRDLGDPAHRSRTITDIAFSWGFSSSSHLSRLFHARFGVSPRQYRAVAFGGEPAWSRDDAPHAQAASAA